MREIVLDTETTGLDPYQGHRVVEIGCVEMFGRVRTGKFFHCYLNPDRDMPEEAYRVHGLSTEFLQDKPRFKDIVGEFLAFLGDSPLVIHNAQFDLKFLNYELNQLPRMGIEFDRAIDTVHLARRKFPGAPASLDALCKRFSIDLSVREKHGALLDAELLADVYLELMGGRQESFTLEALATASMPEAGEHKVSVPLRVFPPSEDELSAHANFIAKLKNPLWNAA